MKELTGNFSKQKETINQMEILECKITITKVKHILDRLNISLAMAKEAVSLKTG